MLSALTALQSYWLVIHNTHRQNSAFVILFKNLITGRYFAILVRSKLEFKVLSTVCNYFY